MELHRAASTAGTLRHSKHRPQSFQMDEQTQILAAMFQLMQQHIAVTAKDKKAIKKSKPWPRPETAEDLIKRQDAEQGYQDLMSEIVFLPQEEFDQHVAEHRDKQLVRRQPGS